MKNQRSYRYAYLATFLLSCATISIEVTLTRLLSVMTWYYLAFFSVSIAMAGMTAGAVSTYLKKRWLPDLYEWLGTNTLLFTAATLLVAISVCLVPVPNLADHNYTMSFLAILMIGAVCALPFYFAGACFTRLFVSSKLPIGRSYAADLIGAACGCLFVTAAFQFLDAPSILLASAGLGGFASFFYFQQTGTPKFKYLSIGSALSLCVLSILNSNSNFWALRLVTVKGHFESPQGERIVKWNSFSRVDAAVDEATTQRIFFGDHDLFKGSVKSPVVQIKIDGDAATPLEPLIGSEYLRSDVTNIGFHLDRKGPTCVIGAGGGRDIRSALTFGRVPVTAIEFNPIIVKLLESDFAYMGVVKKPEVTLVNDEARSFFTRSDLTCSHIQMSLVDTWAATTAGAFALSENALYTVEAWKIFLSHLTPDGVLSVSRWYSPVNPAETARLLSLASTTLLEMGLRPEEHIAIVNHANLATLLISKSSFTQKDITALTETTRDLHFSPLVIPGTPPDQPILNTILKSKSVSELEASVAGYPMKIAAPRDDDPYFFCMSSIFSFRLKNSAGMYKGSALANLFLAGLIVALFILVIGVILVPLMANRDFSVGDYLRNRSFTTPAVYFSLLGLGYMLIEIALMQDFSIFLGHPILSFLTVLTTFIFGTGIGSVFSERISVSSRLPRFIPLAVAFLLLIKVFALQTVFSHLIRWDTAGRVILSAVMIFPLGAMLGTLFPIGMRMAPVSSDSFKPWFIGLNGIFGVFGSAFAVYLSVHHGISVNYYLAMTCYVGLSAVMNKMRLSSGELPVSDRSPQDNSFSRTAS